MRSVNDLEKMKEVSCMPFDNAYDYLISSLEDYYVAKINGLQRIKAELNNWDKEAKIIIVSDLIERLNESDLMGFKPNELLELVNLKRIEKVELKGNARNKPCSCGSGNKYKKCCGKKQTKQNQDDDFSMKKIKLNKDFGKKVVPHGYELDPKQQYCICLDKEMGQQMGILSAIHTHGLPALEDYHKWLKDNEFNVNMPNPTNSFVQQYYGKKPLWTTYLSQGIVVKNENDDDYYIVMECSRENVGFKYTHIILTLGGCM